MPDGGRQLLTKHDVAARLQISERTVRRLLPSVSGLRPIKAGRTMLFSERDYATIEEALRSPLAYASAAKSGTLAAPSVSAPKSSQSPSSAQERVRELTRKSSPANEKPRSGRSSLTVLPGGRNASP